MECAFEETVELLGLVRFAIELCLLRCTQLAGLIKARRTSEKLVWWSTLLTERGSVTAASAEGRRACF
jgi:hypothetical protein